MTPAEAIAQFQTDQVAFHAAVAAFARMWNVVAHSADNTGQSHTGDLTETTLATVTIPANSMGANGLLRVTLLWSFTNSANIKHLITRFDGIAGTIFSHLQPTANARARQQFLIANRGATNLQVGQPVDLIGPGFSTAALVAGAIDTTADRDLVFNAQLANTGETITLEEYLVERAYGA
jgi:hypothetical protein